MSMEEKWNIKKKPHCEKWTHSETVVIILLDRIHRHLLWHRTGQRFPFWLPVGLRDSRATVFFHSQGSGQVGFLPGRCNGKHYRCITSLWDSPLYGNMRFWRVWTGGFMDDSCRKDRSKRFMMFTLLFFSLVPFISPSCSRVGETSLARLSHSLEVRWDVENLFYIYSFLYIYFIYLLSTSSSKKVI